MILFLSSLNTSSYFWLENSSHLIFVRHSQLHCSNFLPVSSVYVAWPLRCHGGLANPLFSLRICCSSTYQKKKKKRNLLLFLLINAFILLGDRVAVLVVLALHQCSVHSFISLFWRSLISRFYNHMLNFFSFSSR